MMSELHTQSVGDLLSKMCFAFYIVVHNRNLALKSHTAPIIFKNVFQKSA